MCVCKLPQRSREEENETSITSEDNFSANTHTPSTPLWLSVCCVSKCGCVYLITWPSEQHDQGELRDPPCTSRHHVKQYLLLPHQMSCRYITAQFPSNILSIKSSTNEFSLLSSEAARTSSHTYWCVAGGQLFTHSRNHGKCETFLSYEAWEWIFQQTIPWMSDWSAQSCFIEAVEITICVNTHLLWALTPLCLKHGGCTTVRSHARTRLFFWFQKAKTKHVLHLGGWIKHILDVNPEIWK